MRALLPDRAATELPLRVWLGTPWSPILGTWVKRMQKTVIWHGTENEGLSLAKAVAYHCTCEGPVHGRPLCGACTLLRDQHVVDGLLFARRIADRLHAEEFALPIERSDD